jgi:hypothetical protein
MVDNQIIIWITLYTMLYYLFGRKHWDTVSRCIAIIHAIGNVILSSIIIQTYGISTILEYDVFLIYPSIVSETIFINQFMGYYLKTDLIFYCIHTINYGKIYDHGFIMMCCHHIIGFISMQAFIDTKMFQCMSIYYSFTEISTIGVNISWIIYKHTKRTHKYWGKILTISSMITMLLFFSVRILGSFFIWRFILFNLDSILYIPYTIQGFIFLGNGALLVLNVIWFSKMVEIALKTL